MDPDQSQGEVIGPKAPATPENKTARPSYFLVFLLLAFFTALEVGASYLPGTIKYPVLGILAITKAALVLLFFMHLIYDKRIFGLPFIIAIGLAIPLLLTVILTEFFLFR